MPTKKKPTEQELKDRLWEMVKTVDFSEERIADVENHPDYNKWGVAMASLKLPAIKVAGFEATHIDLRKIQEEVEHSCLTEKCKKSLLDALKKAK